ncbi:MAG: LamG domain-containing protein, partial [Kofleriaceae bacterium]|nr:LamG domain-containing protein [Kofleriaceae bacterium]
MRVLLAMLLVTGCAFEHGDLPEPPDEGSGSSTGSGSGGTTPTPRVCKFADPSLRLCVEFDDRVYDPVVHDASSAQMDALSDNINEWQRGGSYAAQVDWSSDLRVPETPNLDIAGALTIEMWIAPGFDQDAYLLRNEGQYAMSLDDDGHVQCQINGTTATTQTTIRNTTWAHVGCTYDQNRIKVWIDGKVQGCRDFTSAVSTNGTNGTRIAPAWVGAIDDIRINGRALSLAEMCVRAGTPAGCNDDCPAPTSTGGSG